MWDYENKWHTEKRSPTMNMARVLSGWFWYKLDIKSLRLYL